MHPTLWMDMFSPGLPIIEKVLRAVIVYIFLLLALRLAGRRELAQLNAFDLVVLLTISNTVQNAIIGNDNSVTGGLIGAASIFVMDYLLVRVFYARRQKASLKETGGVVLIEHGRILEAPLKKELITLGELKEAANRQGYESLEEIERAVLTDDGLFAFTRKRKPEPAASQYQEILQRLDRLQDQMRRWGPAGSSL